MKRYVLDTSVIIKWFSEYNEDDLDNALRLRSEIFNGECSIIVPDLLFYELANALRYNSMFTAGDVKDAVGSVVDMGFDVRRVETVMMERAVDIAFRFNVSIYDAYFLAIAQMEKKLFVTADYKLTERVKGFKNIVRLSEVQ